MNITQEQPLLITNDTSFNVLTNYVQTDFTTCEPLVTYWGGLYNYPITEDKVTRSFKLVQKLMDKKIIKEPKTIKQFIELVNLISTEL